MHEYNESGTPNLQKTRKTKKKQKPQQPLI